MIILNTYEPKILPVVPKSEWREPSVSMPRNWLGHKEWHTEFVITAKTKAGYTLWRGVFQDRDDADAFLYAAVRGTLRVEWALHDLPDPIYSPGFYPDELIVWQFAVTSYYTSGTSWTVPSDWNNSSNIITAIGGGADGTGGSFDGKTSTAGPGGGAGACSRITNQSYTPSASRTRQIGASGTDTFLKDDGNSTNAILAKGTTSSTGGASGSGTGSTKYSGGNGAAVSGANGGGGGGAASYTANGSSGSGSSGGASGSSASAGSAGTELGSGNGAGGGGNGGTSGGGGNNGGNYGSGGGGGAQGSGVPTAAGLGRGGLLVVEHTPAAASMNKGFNMPNGW